VLPSG
jgi:FAD/FMN-containing dehydrogenase